MKILHINSKYNGYCKAPGCTSNYFHPGTPIVWTQGEGRRGKGRSYHVACWERMQANGTTASAETAQDQEEQTETTKTNYKSVVYQPPTVSSQIPEVTMEKPNTSDATTAIELLAEVLLKPMQAKLAAIGDVDAKIDAAVTEAMQAAQSATTDEAKLIELIKTHAVRRLEIVQTSEDGQTSTKDLGVQHHRFELLLRTCMLRQNVWLCGPAGTGKTTAAANVAKAMDLSFYFTGAITEAYSLLGFKDASGTYQRTTFREAYENGGVFLFDEIDSSEPGAVLAFNAALANGHCAFPDGIVARHKDCVIIAAANTWGHGATTEYVGRLKLDAATLDRYAHIPWDLDENLESAMCPNVDWLKRVRTVRANVASKGLKILITPRAASAGAELLAAGIDQTTVELMTLRRGMTDQQWESVR